MNIKEAIKLAKKIEQEDSRCNVVGYRKYNEMYIIDVVDTRTGYSFTVYSPDDWEERKKEAK
jgi:hypothetical protein